MSKFLVLFSLLILLTGCFGKDPEVPVVPEEPVVEVPEEPVTPEEPETNLEDEFEEAVKAIPVEEVETFVEVIDEGDADEMLEAKTEEEVIAQETEADQAARVKVRRISDATYRDEMGANDVGLDYRDFSQETFDELYGIRPMVIYFSSEGCTACDQWDETLRNNADKLAFVNALILKADIDKASKFVEDYQVDGTGTALYFSPMGEVMGQVPNPDVDSLIDFFGRFQR